MRYDASAAADVLAALDQPAHRLPASFFPPGRRAARATRPSQTASATTTTTQMITIPVAVPVMGTRYPPGPVRVTAPGHRRGADPRTRAALGKDAFRSDVLATAGLDDRTSSHGYLSRAEELMADAVGAEQAFFSTCGSSLSVKAAMLAVAGGQSDLLISRDAHKSVVAGLVFSGVQLQWIRPRYDTRLHVAHPPSPEQVEQAWQKHPDAAGALIFSPTPYDTCADMLMTTSPNVMVYAALDGKETRDVHAQFAQSSFSSGGRLGNGADHWG